MKCLSMDYASICDKKIDPNVQDAYGLTLLMNAVQKGYIRIMEKLFEIYKDIDTNVTGYQRGLPAFMIACMKGNVDVVRIFLRNCKYIKQPLEANKQEQFLGKTALMLAVEKGHYEIVKLLLTSSRETKKKERKNREGTA